VPDLVVLAAPNTYVASVGAVLDGHALMGELYASNRPLSDYSRMATRVRVVTRDGGPVALAGGRTMASDGGLIAAAEPRLVYLPAFEVGRGDDIQAVAAEDPALSGWLRERSARGAVLAAAGAAAWRLAQAGLLDGLRVCVEPRLVAAFRRAFPRLELDAVQPMSPAAPVMTCGALALEREFVARAFSQAIAPNVGAWLRMCWGAAGEAERLAKDPLVAQAQLWIRERFTEAFRIRDLAASLSVSHQTLIRRFRQVAGVTPRDYAQGLRIHAARMMLSDTTRTVAEIAALVGYSDLPTFRAVFREQVGVTPSAFRLAARASPG
jgi:transcriptional regulator GlxA family with amidase domain